MYFSITEDFEEFSGPKEFLTGKWEQIPYGEFDLPAGVRHGSVLPITELEFKALKEEYGS